MRKSWFVNQSQLEQEIHHHVIDSAETTTTSTKAVLRHVREGKRVVEELRGLRVRGVLQLRVPSRSLEGSQDRLQADQTGAERTRDGERGSAEQRQWWQ